MKDLSLTSIIYWQGKLMFYFDLKHVPSSTKIFYQWLFLFITLLFSEAKDLFFPNQKNIIISSINHFILKIWNKRIYFLRIQIEKKRFFLWIKKPFMPFLEKFMEGKRENHQLMSIIYDQMGVWVWLCLFYLSITLALTSNPSEKFDEIL